MLVSMSISTDFVSTHEVLVLDPVEMFNTFTVQSNTVVKIGVPSVCVCVVVVAGGFTVSYRFTLSS